MTLLTIVVILTLLIILVFSYTNGFHDISNIIATMIASGAMSARQALLMASVFEFVGPLVVGTMVANTIGSLINVEVITSEYGSQHVIIIVAAGIVAAIGWNLVTWYLGLPSSSSHALFGGLVGATLLATRQVAAIHWGFRGFNLQYLQGFAGIAAALFFSPLLGFALGFLLMHLTRFFLKWATPRANVKLKHAQWLTACALAFSHGSNDAPKAMGVMTLVLVAGGFLPEFQVPLWVKITCAGAVALGAMSGGWRIIKTVGRGIFHLRLEHSFNTQIASAMIILGNSFVGGPVSTTHVVSSTVMGVGTAVRKKAVRWKKVSSIVLAWVVTLPVTAILGGIFYLLFMPLAGKI